MLKKLCINIAFITLITNTLHARQISIQQDTLINIIQQEDRLVQQKRLLGYIKGYFQKAPLNQIFSGKDTIQLLFAIYNLPDKEAFSDFTESICLNKNHDLKNAKVYMLRAIRVARKNNDHYLLYQFLSHLSFIQTEEGDFTAAIYSYRMAKKEALMMGDNLLQILLDVNISDLYYKSGFYNQSINYLDQAEALLQTEKPLRKGQLITVIVYNKSENYFRMKNYDSLKVYNKKLQALNSTSYKIGTYRLRTSYYLNLLKHDYATAIKQIKDLKGYQKYVPSDLDNQHLANVYFMNGQLDSAKKVVDNLVANTTDDNHPEIKFHLYELLAQIAEKKGNTKLAADNFKLALKESQENNLRVTQVGNISSQMKIDETENSYIQRTEAYKRERLWLIFMVLVAALSIVAIALIYRNVKQKRHYERLLFAAKREELAFINSHEVRKHLTNILGIMDVLKHSDNKLQEYEELEPHLHKSASLLDGSIKNISEKLNDE